MRTLLLVLSAALAATPSSAQSPSTGTITGVVTDAGTGAPLVDSTVSPRYHIQVFASNGVQVAGRNPGDGGIYAVSSLAPGTYYLKVESLDPNYVSELFENIPCTTADCVPTAGAPIVVASGATTTINVALQRAGRITGNVRRAVDGSPVPGVAVLLHNALLSGVTTVFTEADGRYSIEGVAPGVYFARTRSSANSPPFPDHLDELYGGVVCPTVDFQPRCRVTEGTAISVTAGSTTANVDFGLDQGGRVTGTVTAASGTGPVFAARVSVNLGTLEYRFAVTGADGRYTIDGLPSGTYSVRAAASQALTSLTAEWYDGVCFACGGQPTPVSVTAGSTTPDINFALDVGGGISGTLSFATLPFSGAVNIPIVEVYNARGLLVASALAGPGTAGSYIPALAAGGTFSWTVQGLPSGTYYLKTANTTVPGIVTHVPSPSGGWLVDEVYDDIPCVAIDCSPTRGTPVQVTAGAVTSGITFTVDYGAVITGETRSDGGPIARVRVYDSRGVELMRSRVTEHAPFVTGPPSDPSVYRASGLPAGIYYLKMDRSTAGRHAEVLYKDRPCNGCSVTSGTPVVVRLGETKSGIDFTALSSLAVTGIVRAAGTGTPPLSTITVEIWTATGQLAGAARTTIDGRYRVPGLHPGTYYARTVNARGFVDEIYDDLVCSGCDPTRGTPIPLAAADVSGVDFTLATGNDVSGTVTAGGLPRDGVGVTFLPFTGSPASPVAEVMSDSLGRFTVTLPSGQYRARTDPFTGYTQEVFNDNTCAGAGCDTVPADPVTVTGTPLSGVDFTLSACTAPVIAPQRLALAAVGVAYRQTLLAAGGVAPKRFHIGAGTVPPGLSLDADTGVISGTPTGSGSYVFTVVVVDATGCAGSRQYALDIPACTFSGVGSFFTRGTGEPFLIQPRDTCGDWTPTASDPWIVIDDFSTTPGSAFILGKTLPNSGPARSGTIVVGPRVFSVSQTGGTRTPPFGFVDTPVEGAVVGGSIAVSGWALDDMVVQRVLIYRDPVAGEPGGQVFLGTAVFVDGARPDVEAAFPDVPFNRRAGWGFMVLTNMLPNRGNGVFRLSAYAEDSDLNVRLLGSRGIAVRNATLTAPFGAIDTPAQGGTVSGAAYVNFGWALTPAPKTLPTDGSTIQVFVDGAPVGNVTYNQFRSDVATLFPGLSNSNGAVGYRIVDTTALAEGLHTISWAVTDDAGGTSGIGSRFFRVENSAWTPSLPPSGRSGATVERQTSAASLPATVPGPDLGTTAANLALLGTDGEAIVHRVTTSDPEPILPDDHGQRTLRLDELQRVELTLAVAESDACASTYVGYVVAGGEARPLPAGAALDSAGRFYWQPGAGFLGDHTLLFVRIACDGSRHAIPIRVRIGRAVDR